jgi:hypothetical protein
LEDGERSAWTGKKKHRPVVESIVPLEIALHLNSYYNFLLQSGLFRLLPLPRSTTTFTLCKMHLSSSAALPPRPFPSRIKPTCVWQFGSTCSSCRSKSTTR